MAFLDDFKRIAIGRPMPGLSEAEDWQKAAVAKAVELLNGMKAQLAKQLKISSGTVWEAGEAHATYGTKPFAEIKLTANDIKGDLVTMDRATLTLSPYKTGSVTPVYDYNIHVSRMVRNKKVGQDADVEEEKRLWGGDITLNNMTPRKLIQPSWDFWDSVKELAPEMPKDESRISEGSLGDDTEIAKTIAKQMGGKMKSMLGATLTAVENGLKIKWPNKTRSKGNICVVTLRPDDTYDMEFFNNTKSVKKFEGLHAEDLIRTFETQTGWYLTL